MTRLTVLLVCLAGLGSIAWAQCNTNGCNQTCSERRTISVTGTAQVTADADLAVVRVGYNSTAWTPNPLMTAPPKSPTPS